MEQIVGEKTHFQPDFVRREPVAACLVPAQRVFTFLYPVFNIARPVVNLNHRKCRQPGIGYDEIVAGKQLTHMPLDLGDHSAGLVPTFGLICHVYVFDLNATLRRSADRPVQIRPDQPCQHCIPPQSNKVGNSVVLAKIVDIRIGKC